MVKVHMKTTYFPMEGYKIITSKALDTMHAQHFLITEREYSIYDSCHFDMGHFHAELTN